MAEHVCPWWVGYLLVSPLRSLFQKPERILGAYVREGMTVLDAGCAMGFFSLPLARMVGEKGRVICVDMQERMIRSLEKRANKAGLLDRIETRVCAPTNLELADLEGQVDFAVAIAVVHETRDAGHLVSRRPPPRRGAERPRFGRRLRKDRSRSGDLRLRERRAARDQAEHGSSLAEARLRRQPRHPHRNGVFAVGTDHRGPDLGRVKTPPFQRVTG